MKALLDAIKTYAAAAGSGPLTTTVTGGFHAIVTKATPPYCVMSPIAAPSTPVYGGGDFSEPQIQLAVWDTDSANALTLAEAVRAAFKNKILTLAAGAQFFVRAAGEPIPTPDTNQPIMSGSPMYGWAIVLHYGTT